MIELMRFVLVILSMALLAAGCASEVPTEAADVPAESTAAPTTAPETTTGSTTTSDPEPQADTEPDPPAATAVTPSTATTTTPPQQGCRRVIDFANSATDWFVVNDGVMGGLSEGRAEVANGLLIFDGEINTNGGGFSSVRTVVPAGTFDGASSIRVRFRTEFSRSYEFIVDTVADGIDRRVSYFGEIGATETPDFEQAEVRLADFEARIFGTPVGAPAIDSAEVVGLGIILADGIDGDFALAAEWIDACS